MTMLSGNWGGELECLTDVYVRLIIENKRTSNNNTIDTVRVHHRQTGNSREAYLTRFSYDNEVTVRTHASPLTH